jgi:hypothetical protein
VIISRYPGTSELHPKGEFCFLRAKGLLLVQIGMLAIIVLITTVGILAGFPQMVKPLLKLDFFLFIVL